VTSLVVADYKDAVKQMYEVTNAILYEIYDEANSQYWIGRSQTSSAAPPAALAQKSRSSSMSCSR